MLHKIQDKTLVTLEVFVVFLHIHLVTVDGYVCPGVLLWLPLKGLIEICVLNTFGKLPPIRS